MAGTFFVSWMISVSDGGQAVNDLVNNSNFPGLIALGVGAIPAMFFIVRSMVRFQREFTDFYVLENQKLRDRILKLEEEVEGKDQMIGTLRNEVGTLGLKVTSHEMTIASHEQTIERLNRIIERRKLEE